MSDIQIRNSYVEMQRYPGYPTPPSTNEDSPISVQMLSSPSYPSDNSSSPVHFPQQQVLFMPANYGILPTQTANRMHVTDGVLTEIPPCLNIVEQPLDKFRFRYKSEMTGTHGSLNGENSDKTRKLTYPTVELCNYQGSAIVRCSIWQINHNGSDFMPHAHRLVRKKHGKEETDDPHESTVNKDTNYQATFHSMGIIHTARKNIVAELIKKKTKLKKEAIATEGRTELNKKEEMEIKGLAEAENKSINLNVVCLRFDAYYVGENGVYFRLCSPVFSHGINNLKSALTGELKIVRMDHCTSPASGGREIFLLVERVTKKNVKVRFYELDDDDALVWEAYGRFNDLDVHHQYAIVLRTPPYKRTDINVSVNVFMELVRPSDNAKSEPKVFTYTPVPNQGRPGAKRARPMDFDSNDYDTLSIGNEILPITVQNISGDMDIMNLEETVKSEELLRAINDVNSDEFLKMFEVYGSEYKSAGSPATDISNYSVDFPVNRSHQRKFTSSPVIKPYTFNKDYETTVLRVYQEISEYLKTKPSLQEIQNILNHYLNSKDELNAFHMAVMINDTKVIKFFVKLIYFTQQFDLVNVPSQKLGTVLHLATLCNNLDLINTLISKCNADIAKRDADLNTPLHIAAMEDFSGHLMMALLKAKHAIKFINEEDIEDNTALHLAVKKNNLNAVQILYKNGGNIDYPHKCNGYTPLRFAVENGDFEMVRYILYYTNANPKLGDFRDVDPLQVVLQNHIVSKLRTLVDKYMAEKQITYDEVHVKEEPEDESSEDEMVILEEEVKVEPLALPDLQSLYHNVTSFTDECLQVVSTQLDSSGKWQDLAVLLDIEHCLRMETFDEKESPSRQLLNYVVASNGGSIKEIRDFLENLDEARAVEAMDKMAHQIHLTIS